MLYFHLYKIIFSTFCVFLYITMYILDITKAMKNISINEIKDFIINELDFLKKSVVIQIKYE